MLRVSDRKLEGNDSSSVKFLEQAMYFSVEDMVGLVYGKD